MCKISGSRLGFPMRFSFQIELYWSLRTPLSLVNVCNELFDGEEDFLTEREPEETTTIKGTRGG